MIASATKPRKLDQVCRDAVELARAAAVEVGGDQVGAPLGARADDDRVVTHAFEATVSGYAGWYWAVTVARAPRSKTVTVDEVALLPGDSALLSPEWVPWSERLRPGDLGPGDLLPTPADDWRLVPSYVATDDPGVEQVAFELGVGRVRVLSREGRLDAASRWFDGDFGPETAMARNAPGQCGTCGFLLQLGGSLRAGFGVCGNEMAAADGRIVSVEYGCGAHSEATVEVPPLAEPSGTIYDDGELIDTE